MSHIVTKLNYSRLTEDAARVQRTTRPFECEVQTQSGQWYLLRILPYRTSDNVLDGVVITFTDIEQLKRISREMTDRVESILDVSREPMLLLDSQLRVSGANLAFYQAFDSRRESTVNKGLLEMEDGRWDVGLLRRLVEDKLSSVEAVDGYALELPWSNPRQFRLNARRISVGSPDNTRILLAFEPAGEHEHDQ
jgi:two-component system CheB/CheR fusion protein